MLPKEKEIDRLEFRQKKTKNNTNPVCSFALENEKKAREGEEQSAEKALNNYELPELAQVMLLFFLLLKHIAEEMKL